ncbi:MAG: hypothetical protein IGS38_11080 [Synechococcales cyanobacterium M58_A2018_015]|nr:hypothetical protein [Synechococcales cyanobacterium M58_A2018_015]
MVRALERIEQEIATLNQAVAATAQELEDTDRQYLHALGQATRQQLILASYHICTHGYPEQFLSLPVTQRQHLQQALQQLSKQAQSQILAALVPLSTPAAPNATPSSEAAEVAIDPGPSDSAFWTAAEPPGNDSPDNDTATRDTEPAILASPTLTPKAVMEWQEELEAKIVEILQTLSHRANRLLQDAELLPPQLPEPVLEVAAKADLASETAASPPNLLNLLIETESEAEKEPLMTQIIAVRLRLSEIEFSDAATTAWRSKLRNLLAQLTKLGRDYQRKQKERSIAQAEAAWRATWYEEE